MLAVDAIKVGWLELQDFLSNDNSNAAAIKKINSDADARQKALMESGKKVKDLTLKAGTEVMLAAASLKWKNEDAETEPGGIKKPSIPGVNTNASGGGLTESDGKGKKTNEAVATGGTKHNYITIQIKELIGLKDVNVSNKEAANKAGSEVADELLRVLAMASTATG